MILLGLSRVGELHWKLFFHLDITRLQWQPGNSAEGKKIGLALPKAASSSSQELKKNLREGPGTKNPSLHQETLRRNLIIFSFLSFFFFLCVCMKAGTGIIDLGAGNQTLLENAQPVLQIPTRHLKNTIVMFKITLGLQIEG